MFFNINFFDLFQLLKNVEDLTSKERLAFHINELFYIILSIFVNINEIKSQETYAGIFNAYNVNKKGAIINPIIEHNV